MPALLCVPIMVMDEATALQDAQAARDAGADLVEFRIDEFFTGSAGPEGRLDERELRSILRIVASSPLPCIVTCRAASEGGSYDGDEAARISLYERLGTASTRSLIAATGEPGGLKEHPPRYIDVEHAAYARSENVRQKVNLAVDHPGQRRDVRTGLILSMHDFTGRPPDLLRRLAAMQAEPAASVVKVAYHARSVRDNLELFDLLAENAGGRPMIAIGMGRFGLMSRVLAGKFGGFLTFASLGRQSTTAPGQPTVRELLDVYRFRSVTARTRVFGLIGFPVEHSLSPLVHNAAFEAYWPDTWERAEGRGFAPSVDAPERGAGGGGGAGEVDGVYLPLPVPPEYEHFKATLAALIDHPRLDFCGASVTVPHKQHLVRFAREMAELGEIPWEIDGVSTWCGAANTLVVERDRGGSALRARVVNTDATAAAAWIGEAVGGIAGKTVGIIGAGGAARAVAAGVLQGGASVVVFNRTRENEEALVADLTSKSGRAHLGGTTPQDWKIMAADLGAIGGARCDAFVNCTPVGMKGGGTEAGSPLEIDSVREGSAGAVVLDTVYNPLETPLLRAARRAGMRTADGLGMFVRQAGEQFLAWTGHAAPLQLFDRICRDALSEEKG